MSLRATPVPTDVPGPLSPTATFRLALEIVATWARARRLLRRQALTAVLRELREEPLAVAAPAKDAGCVAGPRLARATDAVLKPLPLDDRCLTRSVVLVSLLARRGIRAHLVLGVTSGGTFAAHAWVEQDGRALTSSRADRYERLTEL